jgi:uncharacterized protein
MLDEDSRAGVDLWPVGHVFRTGHRIRIQIASGAHPRFNRNPGTGQPLASATKVVIAHLISADTIDLRNRRDGT